MNFKVISRIRTPNTSIFKYRDMVMVRLLPSADETRILLNKGSYEVGKAYYTDEPYITNLNKDLCLTMKQKFIVTTDKLVELKHKDEYKEPGLLCELTDVHNVYYDSGGQPLLSIQIDSNKSKRKFSARIRGDYLVNKLLNNYTVGDSITLKGKFINTFKNDQYLLTFIITDIV